jgi:hypothetical protein
VNNKRLTKTTDIDKIFTKSSFILAIVSWVNNSTDFKIAFVFVPEILKFNNT